MLASLFFQFSRSVGTVCQCRQVCALHFHGAFIWIISEGKKRSEYSTINLNNIIFFWLNYMFHWILIAFWGTCLCDPICNFHREWYCITLNIKESQTGQQAFYNTLLDCNRMELYSKDSMIVIFKKEKIQIVNF